MKISAIVLTKNEEANIVDCLESIKFCDEIIVVDDESTDRTVEILERLSKENPAIKVYKRKLENDFSKQRQFGIEKSTNDWILFLDADERIPEELAAEIKDNLDDSTTQAGFLIKRRDYMWGKPLDYGETGHIRLLRLFNKNKGSLKGTVHETWQTKNSVGYLQIPIKHYPHPTISEFLREINFYTDLRAEELYRNGKKTGFFRIILYPKGKFIYNYFIKLGFLDGMEGFMHAILMSFHSFLVRGKLWLLWQKKSSL